MSNLVAQYNRNLASYEAVTAQFQSLLALLLQNQSLHIHSITGRTKDQNSLAQKINKNNHKYHALGEITDLCGIRIITYYEDEVDKIAGFIRKHFSIDQENSIDKRQSLAPDQFGYQSLHLIVNLPVNAKGICKNAWGKIYKVEIQIRSLLQHAWAEIEHDLQYKNPSGTTASIRRRFSRVAGLLELADQEFRSIRTEVTATGSSVPEPLAGPSAAMKLTPAARDSGVKEVLQEFPNFGWAACVTLLFFILAFLVDWYFGTKITHLAQSVSTLPIG